jgi:predicted transcriptional regulator
MEQDSTAAAAVATPPVTFEDVRTYFNETVHQPDTTAAAHLVMFRRVVASREQLTVELSKLKVAQLSRMAGMSSRDEKKAELVQRVLDDIVEDFALGRVRAGGVGMRYFQDAAYRLEKNAKVVEALTDDDLDEYRRGVAEARARRADEEAERQRAVTNPVTLEDFETAVRHRGIAALKRDRTPLPKGKGHSSAIEALIRRAGERELTDEELARYDELRADQQRERRGREMVAKATVKRIDIGEGNYMEIVPSYHTKHECDIWLVVLAEREDEETFIELCEAARKLGGNYSRAWMDRPGGFQFFDEKQAEKFVQLQSRDVFDLTRLERLIGRRERVRSNAVVHFQALAGRMEDRASDVLHRPRLENTERRIMLAERARDGAHEDLAMAGTLRAHAEALLARTARHLDRIRWRTHAEALDRILSAANGRVPHVEYPWPCVPVHTLREIAKQIYERDGSKLISRRVLKMCDEARGGEVVFYGSHADTLRHFYRRARIHRVKGWALDRVREALGDFKRMRLNNLDTLPELRAALREHMGRRVEREGMSRAEKVMRDLYPGEFPPDYFPTPRDVVELMLEYADLEDGMFVLEPSAGSGHICNVIRELYPSTRFSLVELSGMLCEALRAQGWAEDLRQADFLGVRDSGVYDRVIANVPFGCDGVGTDIDHVMHAFSMLKPGGRLVSLMSEGVFYRGDGKAQEFRAWLDSLDGQSFELPEGAFLNSDRPTSWAARVVVIDRPLEDAASAAALASVAPEGQQPLAIAL